MGTADLDPDAVAAFHRTEQVVEALPEAIVVTDSHGLVVGANRQADELYGWASADVVGSDVRQLIASTDSGPTPDAEVLVQVLAGASWQGDLEVTRQDGSTLQVHAVVAPLLDQSGRVVGAVSASEDVTAQRTLETRAAELTDRLRLALDAGALGTWRWDVESGAVIWDERMEATFGLAPGEFDGTFEGYVALLHPDDREEVLATVAHAVAERGSYAIDHRVVWPDGSVHWIQGRGQTLVDVHGEAVGTGGCVSDITTLKAAAAAAERQASALGLAAHRERLRHERLEFLAGLTDASLAARDHEEFIELVTNAAVPRLGDWCALYFMPEVGGPVERRVAHVDSAKVAWVDSLSDRHPYDPDAATGVAAVIRTGTTEFLPVIDQTVVDATLMGSDIDAAELREILEALALTSVITVPLTTPRGVIGAVQFVSAESGQRYDEEDLSLAKAAAGRIAAALDNLWFTEQHRAISAALQRALLPPDVPAIEGVDLAVRYWPAGSASEVGGDFYDVFDLGHRRSAIVIGDVCGTGPNAAAVTSIARHTVRAAARHDQDHATVLGWLNEAVNNSGRGLFCTACYATLEPSGGGYRLRSAAAGHPLPLIVRADGRVERLGRPGTLLGVFPDTTSHTAETDLGAGDSVVFYTDGVTDLPPPFGLDDDQVATMMAEAVQGRSAKESADAIDEFLSDRLPSTQRRDDTALVVLRIDPEMDPADGSPGSASLTD
jgi:PAS domain S-box-containing protein